jgi:hypothetical protein
MSFVNEYAGFDPKPGWRVAETSADAATPSIVFAHIARCEPLVIRGGAARVVGGTAAVAALELPSLRRAAGAELVHVEHAVRGGFGCGHRSQRSFAAFADALAAGEEGLYLSTQPVRRGRCELEAARGARSAAALGAARA